MAARGVLQVFQAYQRARNNFVQNVAEMACKSTNIEFMKQSNVLELIKPLLQDPCANIRQYAAIALGRLVENDAKTAENTLNTDMLPTLLSELDTQNKFIKKSVLYVIKSLCKSDAATAQIVIRRGGLNALIYALGDFEQSVKEGALSAIANIARHNKDLAQHVIEAGAIPSVVLCLQEPEVSIKQLAASVLGDVCKHSTSLAQYIADSGAIVYLAKALNNNNEKLKCIVLNTLSYIAKHSSEMAELVVECDTFPSALIHLAHSCGKVRKHAACLVRDVAKHSLALAQMIVNLGGIGAIIECVSSAAQGPEKEELMVPCFVALGYIAGQNDQISLSVINCNGVDLLAKTLLQTTDETLLAVCVWTMGQIGKHSAEHAKAIACVEVFPKMLAMYNSPDTGADLSDKCKNTLKQCLQKCMVVSALEPLVKDAPPSILKYVLGQYSRILPNDPKARRTFVTSGALKKLQEIDAEPGTTLMEYVTLINSCFPEEIVRYYSPGFSDTVLELVENYTPQIMSTILRDAKTASSEKQTDTGYLMDESTSSSQDLKDILA